MEEEGFGMNSASQGSNCWLEGMLRGTCSLGPGGFVVVFTDVWHSSGRLWSLKRDLDAFELYLNIISVQFCGFRRFRENSLPLKSFKTDPSGACLFFICPCSPRVLDVLQVGEKAGAFSNLYSH